jgi:Flp pilus assembly protein TadG
MRGERLIQAVDHKQRCRKFWRRIKADSRKGSAALEFAMIAPVFFVLLMGTFEAAIMFFSQAALQNALTTEGRLIRTGQASSAAKTQAQFRTDICNMVTPLIACDGNLQIDVESFSSGYGSVTYTSPLNSNNTLNTSLNNYSIGNACDVVLVRAFYTMPIYTPALTWFLVNMAGNKHLVSAATAFRNEPYTTTTSGC